MIVIVADAVFGSPRTSALGLATVVQLCFEDRHILVTDPVFGAGATPAITSWLAALPVDLRTEATLVLQQGPATASQQPNQSARVRIEDVVVSDYRQPIPVLTLDDALWILQMPLRLLVENARNDGAFLRKIVPPLFRAKFLEALRHRWAEFENGGGIGELTARVNEVAKDARAWMRLWVMFDSDARAPNAPSTQSTRASQACAGRVQPWPVVPTQLARRAIENYLPSEALFAWADLATGAARKPLRRAAEAFQQLAPDQRAHYNLKNGLFGDLNKVRRAWHLTHGATFVAAAETAPLFQGLDDATRKSLHSGFGDDVARLYDDSSEYAGVLQEDWLRKEIPQQVRTAIFQSIFDRI